MLIYATRFPGLIRLFFLCLLLSGSSATAYAGNDGRDNAPGKTNTLLPKTVLSLKHRFGPGDTIRYTGSLTICPGNTIALTANNAPDNAVCVWRRDNVIIPGASTRTFNASLEGKYTVSVTTPAGLGPYDTVTVAHHQKPNASFVTDQSTVCSGANIRFTSTVSGGRAPYKYFWRFGDGSTSTLANPVAAIDTLGCGTVNLTNRLIVEDANGCRDTVINPITVRQAPRVAVEDRGNIFSPFKNCRNADAQADSSYTLTITNTSPDLTCIASYNVNWGDGTIQNNLPASAFPLTYTYRELGAFNLVVTAVGTNGCNSSRTYQVANQSNPAGGLGTLGATTNLCAPSRIPFIISNWQKNSPGTSYLLDFGDGTSVTLTHPLNDALVPDTVYHTYTTSSCPNPSFEARLLVINACDATPYTAGNIQIRIRPQAAIDSVMAACAGRNVNFNNATILGNFGPNCQSTTQFSWNFGDPGSGANNTSNGVNPTHVYSTPGVYTVTLTASNPCGTTTATRQVCVTGVPAPAFTLDNAAGCGPLTVRATNSSNALTGCSPGTVRWSVTYAPAFCGTGSDWSFTNGTSATSLNPVFQFRNPGNYTITLELTNACGSVATSRTVTVKSPPQVALNTVPNACGPVSFRPVATVLNCGQQAPTYRWTFQGGTPATATTADPGLISFTGAGTKTITLEVTNECGTTTQTRQFLVSDIPQLTVPASAEFCTGLTAGPFSFTSSTPGAIITWTASNAAIGLPAASGTGNIAAFTTTNTGNTPISSVIRVTATANGCTGTAEFTVTVNPRPAAPTVTTPVGYCVGDAALPLTANAGTNTLRWYTTATGGTGSANAPTPNTTAPGSTTYYVSALNTQTGCEGPRSAITVNVFPAPVVTSATSANPAACASATGSITLNGLLPNTAYQVNYLRNGAPVAIAITSGPGGAVVIPNLAAGSYTAIRVTLNGCSSAEAGPFTLTDPNPPATPTAASNGPVCSGTTLQLTATGTATGTVSYAWTGPAAFTSTLQNPVLTGATVAMSGRYFVTVTQNGCTSAPAQVDVVVNPTPPSPTVGSNSPICAGSNLTLTSNIAFTGTVSYAWTGPNGFVSNLQNPVINAAGANASGVYTLVATSATGNCAAAPVTLTATVNRVPAISNAVAVQPQSCTIANGSIRLEGLEAGQAYLVRYRKNNAVVTANLIAGADGNLVIVGLNSGIYSDIEVELNNCRSNPVGPFTLSDPNPPAAPTATTNSPVCSGNSLALAATHPAAGTVTWTWIGPGGFITNDQNPTIPNTTVAMSGAYAVSVTQNGCTSPSTVLNVVINPSPNAPVANSNSPVCAGSTLTLTGNANFTGALAYAWTGPNGFISNLQNPVIVNATPLASGDYRLVVTSVAGNCPSPAAIVTALVNPLPNISNAAVESPQSCNSATGSIQLNGLEAGRTYTVRYRRNNTNQLANLTAAANGSLRISNLAAGTYTDITAELNGCRSNAVGPFVLSDPNPPAVPEAGTNGPLCSGSTLELTATGSGGGVSYAWSGPNGFSSTAQNPTRENVTATMSGKYYITATRNGCTSLPDSVTVVINTTPNRPDLSSNAPICEGNTLTLSASNDFTGALNYQWTGPNGFTSNQASPSIPNAQAAATGTYRLLVRSQAGNCPAPEVAIAVEVARIPAISGATFAPPQFCASATGVIRLEGLEAGKTYTVRYRKNNNPQEITATATLNGILMIPNLTAGNYTDIEARYLTCGSNRVGPFQLLDPNPPTAPVVRSNSPLCAGSTLELFAASATAGDIVYTWTGPDGFTSNTQNTTRSNIQPNQSGNYTVVATLEGCASRPVSVDILVNPYPGAPVISNNSPQCIGNAIRINATVSYPGAVTYRWTGPNGFSSNEPNIVFPNAQPNINGDYRLVVTATQGGCSVEAFANVSVGPPPTIDLGTGGTYPTGTEIRLRSTVTNGPVRSWEWTPSTSLSCNNCPEPVATIKKDITYQVRITNIYGCEATDTISFRTFCESAQVYIPNAFTPDGDGSNDILVVRGKGISAVRHFRIFNRWGEVVFERNNFAPNDPLHAWDGKVRGVVQGPGVYVYTAEVVCDNGATYVYKGNVSIIR